MKTFITLFFAFIIFESSCFSRDSIDYSKITPQQIAQTADHLDRLLKDSLKKTAAIQSAYNIQGDKLKKANDRADLMEAKATSEAERGDLWEHRTEVIVELFAAMFAAWLGTILSGQILKNWPSLEGWAGTIAVYILCFLAGMWIVNHFIDVIGHVIPTVPSWDETSRWVHSAWHSKPHVSL